MLSRAARRRYALRSVQNTASQIQLHWLCPALAQPQKAHRQSRSISSHPPGRRKSHQAIQAIPTRHLASAAGPAESFASHDDYIPFPYSSATRDVYLPDSEDASQSWSSPFEQMDLSEILSIDHSISQPPPRLSSNHRYGIEIHGDARDIEVTLQACLQVHRWDRAFALLRQLGLVYNHNPQELLDAYNKCLEAMVMDLVWNRNQSNIERINKWIEVDMKKAGIEPDARTYALRLKTALASMTGSKRDRTVRRYWELAKGHNFEAEVAGLRGILTDNDLGRLSEICPQLKYDFQITPGSYAEDDASQPLPDTISDQKDVNILETAQKGLGLSSLRKSLSIFSDGARSESTSKFRGLSDEARDAIARDRQMRLEADAIDAAVERWQSEHDKMAKMGINGSLQHGRLGVLCWQFYENLTQKIRKELQLVSEAEAKPIKTSQDKLRSEYGPFLRLLKPEHLSAMTLIAIMQTMSKLGIQAQIKLGRVVCEIGRTLETEVEAEQLRQQAALRKKKGPGSESRTAAAISNDMSQPLRHQSKHHNSRLYSKKLFWSSAIHARVGAILCELLFDSARVHVVEDDPATGKPVQKAEAVFLRQAVYQSGKRIGMISLHPSMVKALVAQPAGDLIAKQLPMVSKPRPWTGFYEGGYLGSNQSFLRVKSGEMMQRDYGEAAAARGDLDQVFAGVDVLGRTAWKVNGDVFNVMLEAWNSGQAIANLPPVEKVFPEPTNPGPDADAKSRWQFYTALRAIENEKSGLHSNRCFQNFQMEIAKAYVGETFYLPHNVDFRGRAYPIPPYLNQMGADNCRGLLAFARGRVLGTQGLRWLKIHLSNVYGYDKASLADRENFPMEHIADIRDSVRDPLGGNRWWLTAEDPWQCLAACFELTQALEQPDSTQFVSHLPIHQDGSCNGLQHYAALGGDVAGAKQVNLEPGDKPADVYTGVAELVKAEIKQDAARGDEMATFLDGKITRKVVKQTVMTNVYGVTFMGAVRQVRKQLDDLIPELAQQRRSGVAASYIARKIFKGLGSMFTGAHDIQYWLGDCANRISSSLSPSQLELIFEKSAKTVGPKQNARGQRSKSKAPKSPLIDPSMFRSSVIWTTPLKLPVVQPYRVNKGRRVTTNLQQFTLREPTIADAVHKRKQLQAFPPNFVHSLDATHMLLSALKADEMGLDFTAVHDSFWTHAADVDTMNHLLREAFIRMHSEDIIGRLAAEFKQRYRGHLYLASVKCANVLGKDIKAFRSKQHYTFGRSAQAMRYQELLWETERQRLLNSQDPGERSKGEAMVTPASIFDKHHGEQYLVSKDSLGQTAIGAVPDETSDAVLEDALQSKEVNADVDMATTLEPLLENNAVVGGESLDGTLEAGAGPEMEEEMSAGPALENDADEPKPKAKKARQSSQALSVWLPLTFRDVPKKGNFDVNRLRDSQYFFS